MSCTESPQWATLAPEVVAGIDTDNSPVAVCRAAHEGGMHPGKMRMDGENLCTIGWGGESYQITADKLFEGLQLTWAKCPASALPLHAYQFGEEPDHTPLYPCRAVIEGQQHLGRIGAAKPACLIPYGGGEREIGNGYEVLVNNPEIHFPIDAETLVVDSVPPRFALTGVALDSTLTEVFHFCSATWYGGKYPGKIRSDWKACNITYLGEAVFVSRYNVLVPSFKPHDPDVSFWVAGKESNGELLGICRVDYPGRGVMLGKYLHAEDRCSFADGLKEVTFTTGMDFEVLRGAAEGQDESEATRWGTNTTYFFDASTRNVVNVCFNGAFNWDGEIVDGVWKGRVVNGVRQGTWTNDISRHTQEIDWFKAAMDNWSVNTGVAFFYFNTCPQPIPLDFVPVVFTNVDTLYAMGGWARAGIAGRVADSETLQGADLEHQIGLSVLKNDSHLLTEEQFKVSAVHEMGHALGLNDEHGGNGYDAASSYACRSSSAEIPNTLFASNGDPDSIMNHCRDINRDGVADSYRPEVNEEITPLDKAVGQIVYGFPSPWIAANRNFCVGGKMYTGKFNADNRTDILCNHPSPGLISVDLADPSGRFDSVDWTRSGSWCLDGNDTLVVGDVDGDALHDLLCLNSSSGGTSLELAQSDGSFRRDSWVGKLENCTSPTNKLFLGKFNADERSDILCSDSGSMAVYLADDAGHFERATWTWQGVWCNGPYDSILVGDVNGDGYDDLVCHRRSAGGVIVDFARPDGSFPADDWVSATGYCAGTLSRAMLADVDGDGKADLLCRNTTTGSLGIAFGASDRFTELKLQGPFARFCAKRDSVMGTLHAGKYTGGARSDLLCNYQSGDSAGYMEVQFSKMPQIVPEPPR